MRASDLRLRMVDRQAVLAGLPRASRHLEVDFAEGDAVFVEHRTGDDDAFARQSEELQRLAPIERAKVGAELPPPVRRVLP